jgi:hypothetical protein
LLLVFWWLCYWSFGGIAIGLLVILLLIFWWKYLWLFGGITIGCFWWYCY